MPERRGAWCLTPVGNLLTQLTGVPPVLLTKEKEAQGNPLLPLSCWIGRWPHSLAVTSEAWGGSWGHQEGAALMGHRERWPNASDPWCGWKGKATDQD